MVEISLSGSGEGLGWVTSRGYSTAAAGAGLIANSSLRYSNPVCDLVAQSGNG